MASKRKLGKQLDAIANKMERGEDLTSTEMALVQEAIKHVPRETVREQLFNLEMNHPESYKRVMELAKRGDLN